MTVKTVILLTGLGLLSTAALAAESWATTDWDDYMEFVESLTNMPDEDLVEATTSPPVVYGFLLAAGEVLDAIALGEEYKEYHINVRRHANRCAYHYVSDRFTYQQIRGDNDTDWPYGGVVFAAQEAFDECLVINLENDRSGAAGLTRYLTYTPP